MDRALDQLGGLGMLAEGLDGDARNKARARSNICCRLVGPFGIGV